MKRLLVADDEKLIRHLICATLEDPGIHIDQAANGVEALALLEHTSYDLIISDLRMPRLDGLGLLAAARQKWPTQPFILISASFNAPLAPRDKVYFVGKPFELDALTACVEQALAQERQGLAEEAVLEEV